MRRLAPSSGSVGVGWQIGGGGAGIGFTASATVGAGGGGSFSASRTNIESEYASVGEQSGIRPGDGGFDICPCPSRMNLLAGERSRGAKTRTPIQALQMIIDSHQWAERRRGRCAGAGGASQAAPGLNDLQHQMQTALQDAGVDALVAQEVAGLGLAGGLAALSGVAGGNATAGAAFNTDENNRQLHADDRNLHS